VTVRDAAPAEARLSATGVRTADVTVTADLWWGTNATSYRFLLDGVVVGSGELVAKTPGAQRASVTLTGVRPGKHTLVAVFANANGKTVTLNVASDNPNAVKLYERAGMRQAWRVDDYLKALPD